MNERFIITSISICLFLTVLLATHSCTNDCVSVSFFPQGCDLVDINLLSDKTVYEIGVKAIGNPIDHDLFMEQQVLDYLAINHGIYKGKSGSVFWVCRYVKRACLSISVTADNDVLGRPSGTEICDLFVMNNVTDDFLFDSEGILIERLPSQMTIDYYLSKHPMMLEFFKLTSPVLSITDLSGIQLSISIVLDGNESFSKMLQF